MLPGSQASPSGPNRRHFWPAGIGWITFCLLVLGAIDAWAGRKSYLVGDTTSYISIARNIAANGVGEAINGYWSPLYPIYMSVFVRPFLADSYLEFAATRLANFLVYCLILAAFQYFLFQYRSYCFSRPGSSDGGLFTPTAFWIAAHAIFIWACFTLNLVCRMSPDGGVMAVFFLACGRIGKINGILR
jgi:hypothetical protein